MPNKLFKTVTYTGVDSNGTGVRERIIKETALEIHVNGKHLATVMCLATLEKELVVGYLFSQGIINSAGDIKTLTIKKNIAETVVNKKVKNRTPNINSTLKVSTEDIYSCVQAILKSKIFAETEAVHSAGLFWEAKKPICIAEDLGRHHALDKVIGYGLLHNVDFSRTVAASTGRMTAEMVTKVGRAGIPVIATKGAVTDKGRETAKKYRLTLIGFVRNAGIASNTDMGVRVFKQAGMKIYCGASRINCKARPV